MRIEVLGTAFTIETDEDPEYVADIVDYYKTKVQEIRKSVSTSDPLKISILSGLLVIDELFRERARDDGASDPDRDPDRDSDEGTRIPHSDPEEVARITDELIEKLNETLQATDSHAQSGEHQHGDADTEGDQEAGTGGDAEDEPDTDSERPG